MQHDHWLPQPGDSLFVQDNGPHPHANLGYYRENAMTLDYIEAYRAGGDAIIQAFLDRPDGYREDCLFLSALNSYRHYIELHLKHNILWGRTAKLCNVSNKELCRHHELIWLWLQVRALLPAVWPELEFASMRAFQRLVYQIHRIDPNGQSFRYSVDTKDRLTMKRAPERVNMVHLSYMMLRVHRFFLSLEEQWDKYFMAQDWE